VFQKWIYIIFDWNEVKNAVNSRTKLIILNYSHISNEPDFEFAKRLTAEHGVAAIPPSALYHQKDDHKVLRFCFAKKSETLESAAEKLCQV
jgi:methionine aminotransferase